MDANVTLITLAVADVAQAVRFYRDGLGWRMSALSVESTAFFQCGAVVLSLYHDEDFASDLGSAIPEAGATPRHTLAQNVASRELVDDAIRAASTAGATRIIEPADTSWGGYVGYFADPDGHVWEVAWNPEFILSDSGALTLPA